MESTSQISNFGSPLTILVVSRLTVMTRRKSSSGYLGLFIVSVAQRLASFTMPLDVVGGHGLAFHDPLYGGFTVDDAGVGLFRHDKGHLAVVRFFFGSTTSGAVSFS
jgi:hypothetical protein